MRTIARLANFAREPQIGPNDNSICDLRFAIRLDSTRVRSTRIDPIRSGCLIECCAPMFRGARVPLLAVTCRARVRFGSGRGPRATCPPDWRAGADRAATPEPNGSRFIGALLVGASHLLRLRLRLLSLSLLLLPTNRRPSQRRAPLCEPNWICSKLAPLDREADRAAGSERREFNWRPEIEPTRTLRTQIAAAHVIV